MDDSVLATPHIAQHQLTDDSEANSEVTMKLYEGSSLSTEASHILISSYMCRHHLTRQAREDLLQLLQIHLPKENQLQSSLYTFYKLADHGRDITPDYHHYCSQCYTLLPSGSATVCPNQSCNAVVNKESSNFFITVSIADQLQILLSSKPINCMKLHIQQHQQCVHAPLNCTGHDFYHSLMMGQRECEDHGIADIHDGNVYRAMNLQPSNGIINISLTLNTDGALVYQSTSCSMWPVLLMVNELPFSARYNYA